MTGRGGARPGSGRPRLGNNKKSQITLTLRPEILKWLEAQAERTFKTASVVAEDCFRWAISKGFEPKTKEEEKEKAPQP